jgi:hypothetical protein
MRVAASTRLVHACRGRAQPRRESASPIAKIRGRPRCAPRTSLGRSRPMRARQRISSSEPVLPTLGAVPIALARERASRGVGQPSVCARLGGVCAAGASGPRAGQAAGRGALPTISGCGTRSVRRQAGRVRRSCHRLGRLAPYARPVTLGDLDAELACCPRAGRARSGSATGLTGSCPRARTIHRAARVPGPPG